MFERPEAEVQAIDHKHLQKGSFRLLTAVMKGVLVIGFGSGEFICQKGEFLLIDCHVLRLFVGPATSLANQLALVEHISRINKQE